MNYLELDESKTPVPANATLTLNAAGITAIRNLLTSDVLDELEHDYRQLTTTPDEKNAAILPGILAVAAAAGVIDKDSLDAFNRADGRNGSPLSPVSAAEVTSERTSTIPRNAFLDTTQLWMLARTDEHHAELTCGDVTVATLAICDAPEDEPAWFEAMQFIVDACNARAGLWCATPEPPLPEAMLASLDYSEYGTDHDLDPEKPSNALSIIMTLLVGISPCRPVLHESLVLPFHALQRLRSLMHENWELRAQQQAAREDAIPTLPVSEDRPIAAPFVVDAQLKADIHEFLAHVFADIRTDFHKAPAAQHKRHLYNHVWRIAHACGFITGPGNVSNLTIATRTACLNAAVARAHP